MNTSNPSLQNEHQNKLNRLSKRTSIAVTLLIVLCLLWETMIAPTRSAGSGFPWLALKALLLVPILPRLLRGERRAFQVLTLLILLYLTEACVRAYSDLSLASRVCAWIELMLSGGIFVLANWFARSSRPVINDTQIQERKPRPKGMVQLLMYVYASFLVLFGMSFVYTPDGTESARFYQVLLFIRVGFILFNLVLIARVIINGRARSRAAGQTQV